MLGKDKCIDCPPHSNCHNGGGGENPGGGGSENPTCDVGYVSETQQDGSILCLEIGGGSGGDGAGGGSGKPGCDLGEYGYGTIDGKTGECILLGCLGSHHVSSDGKRCEQDRAECVTANGIGFKDWNGSSYGACVETSCYAGYQLSGGQCSECNRENALTYKQGAVCNIDTCRAGYHTDDGASCVSNVKPCVLPNAAVAQSVWANGQYGACAALACESGYTLFKNACVRKVQACTIANGVGYQEWIGSDQSGSWGECQVDHCNPGYTGDPSETSEKSKPCGVCNNKYSSLGEVAVAAYTAGCEIATCLYPGELYDLDNNECIPICPAAGTSDESGTAKWNPATKKCDISCGPGYLKW
jgi:hypothetical protein